jgi:hypothetical protein
MPREIRGALLLPEPGSKSQVAVFVHDIRRDLKTGDRVIDCTAEENGWLDDKGIIEEIDGSNIKVRYNSGQVRWKMNINLRKDPQGA